VTASARVVRVAGATPKRRAGAVAHIKPPATERSRARRILARLERAHPDWGPTLEFADPLQLLVATILAAQARDERINEVTRAVVFPKYRTAADYVAADIAVLERELRPTGFFRQKAKAVKAAAQGIVDEFGGIVPSDLESLVRLRGVGRKTASIVLGAAFGVPAIAVDRHVARTAARLGLTRQTDPDRIEQDLRQIFAEKDWVKATWCLVRHGRSVCTPTPRCPECPVLADCPYPKKTKPAPAKAAPR
jgi:endonuclease-3